MFFVLSLLSVFYISIINAEDYSKTYYYNQQYQDYNSHRDERLRLSQMYTTENDTPQCLANQNTSSCSAKVFNEPTKPSYTPVVYNKHCGNPRCFFIALSGGLGHTIGSDATPDISEKKKTNSFYGMIIGANATDKFKIGLEGLRTFKHVSSNAMGDFTLRSTTLIPNFYFMMPYSMVRPYVLFGIGAAYNKLSNNNGLYLTHSNKAKLAYQIGAGININYDKVFLNAEAKYIDRGQAIATNTNNPNIVQKIKLKDMLLGLVMGYNL